MCLNRLSIEKYSRKLCNKVYEGSDLENNNKHIYAAVLYYKCILNLKEIQGIPGKFSNHKFAKWEKYVGKVKRDWLISYLVI